MDRVATISRAEIKKISDQYPILFFDGLCNFCNGFVKFVLRYDKESTVKFCALQEEGGKLVRQELGIGEDLETALILYKGKFYRDSDVSFFLFNHIGGWWKILNVFRILPLSFRNYVYALIARNRYKWFGKRDTCMIPRPEDHKRFIR